MYDNHTRCVEYRGRFIVSLSPHRAELLLHSNGNLLGHVPDACEVNAHVIACSLDYFPVPGHTFFSSLKRYQRNKRSAEACASTSIFTYDIEMRWIDLATTYLWSWTIP